MNIFDVAYEEYDSWYEKNVLLYYSEIEAIKPHLDSDFSSQPLSLEVGVGTGRFAQPLNVDYGLDLSFNMLKLAKERGLKVIRGRAEALPFKNNSFDLVLMIVTLCFLENPDLALKEINRILKREGKIILGFVDKESFLGKIYLSKQRESKFYAKAKFYSTEEVIDLLKKHNFIPKLITQTIFQPIPEIKSLQPVKIGYGEGGFVVLSAYKKNSSF